MMKLYALKCDQGYLRRTESGSHLVAIEKATVVPENGIPAMDALAEYAARSGCQDIHLVELLVSEGDRIKSYSFFC